MCRNESLKQIPRKYLEHALSNWIIKQINNFNTSIEIFNNHEKED
jgi:hypothetical protein